MPVEQITLSSACLSGNLEKVKSLVLKDPKPSKDALQEALGDAVASSHDGVVALLLENGAHVDECITTATRTCTSIAIFQCLLDHGWDINAMENYGYVIPLPPTLWFVVCNEELLKWFLEHGADPNINPGGELSPLDRAARDGTPAAIALLLKYGARLDNSNALHAATNRPLAIPMMTYILDLGFNINAFNISKRPATTRSSVIGTALHVAAKGGYVDRVRFLLDRGADRNMRHPEIANGMTAAEWAKKFGKTETYRILSVESKPMERK